MASLPALPALALPALALPAPALPVPTLVRALVLVVLLLSALAVWRLDHPRGRWGRRLRARLLMGVPWGTLLVVALVLGDYLFVQGGWGNWLRPVTIPFASWSYLYPLGWLTAPFSHQGVGHLLGNLLSTVALAPLAEYAFGHFPQRRGSSSFASWRTNPYVRALVLFPLGVVLVGYASVLFQWGPVIGFSGVVFAFAGFALVRFPIATVAAVTARGLVSLLYDVLQDPVVEATAGPGFSAPWWANVAIQGHLLGFLLGITLGVVVFGRREERPSALRVWVGATLVASAMSLWVVWWYRGASEYVLHRGVGAALVVAVAALAALAVRGRGFSLPGDVSARQSGVALLLIPLLVMAGVAVPVNLSVVDDTPAPEQSVQVRDYQVTYAEGVYNPKVPVVNLSVLGERSRVQTGGVIVVSDRRELWSREFAPNRLAFDGTLTVLVGGVGWRRDVKVQRRGWSAAGGGTAYQVWLWVEGQRDQRKHVFASGNATARPVLAGRNVTVVPRAGEFSVRVTAGNRTLGRAPVPAANESVRLGGLRLVRDGNHVLAAVNRTRVRVLEKETYE